MTTQRTSWALAREAAGLFLTASGLLGVLVALGTLHWAAGLSAASGGLIALGLLLKPKPDAARWTRTLCATAITAGCAGLILCAFALSAPVGWICVSASVAFHGLWLTSRDDEGAA
ncbi:hypothetical protein OG345_41765 (plasmid) [Streptomyces sp. NBC_01220]|uniref:hypothetical protein n=1 Tax=Streptomyces sp. NBC_01220 TaxID=2903781 RepID=UPI00352F9847|nr:hypothetical protein OG345_41765 [Streptomyces sp. NBC_01220]